MIEQQGADLAVAQRLALRQQLALPALAELHARLQAQQRNVAAGSGTAKAIDHALKRWAALERYANSGSLPICHSQTLHSLKSKPQCPGVPAVEQHQDWN
ncbi:transposase [Rugamonas sp. CCM 8940]|uniref:IS66 family transposase n=1 Tax=Rugamonas sp. CCM 8940 TaxID=2765359 RepID=UPI00351C6C72